MRGGGVLARPQIKAIRMHGAGLPARDLRIDFFRGLALWMIFVDHIDGNWISRATYRSLGFSDAKEIFIFLSGISCWLLYSRLERERGLLWAEFRALYRAAQIYLGYVLVAFFAYAMMLTWRGMLGPALTRDFALLFEEPARALVATAFLYYTPGYLDILPVYLWLVAGAPLAIWALRRAPLATMAGSAALWLAAATNLIPGVPNLGPGGVATLNPCSWQFLFCTGLWTGLRFYHGEPRFRPTRGLQCLALAIVLLNLLCTIADHLGRGPLGARVPLLAAVSALRAATRLSANENVLRLSHFFAVAYLTAGLVRVDWPGLRARLSQPLIMSGQFSLQIFCLGILLSYTATVYGEVHRPDPFLQLLLVLAGCALMALFALMLSAVRDERRVKPAALPVPDAPPLWRRAEAPAGPAAAVPSVPPGERLGS